MIVASTTDASRTDCRPSMPPNPTAAKAEGRKMPLFRCGCAGNLILGWWERCKSDGKRVLRWGEELGSGNWSFGGKSVMGIFEI